MGRHEQIISDTPPASRVPAVIEHLQASKRALAALELDVPQLLLAVAEKGPGADADLTTLRERIEAAKFTIENHANVRELAARLDAEALVEFKAAVQKLPVETIIEGITKEACCRRCVPGVGCAITGSDALAGPCQHPLRVGPLELDRYRQNPKIMAIYNAACAMLGVSR